MKTNNTINAINAPGEVILDDSITTIKDSIFMSDHRVKRVSGGKNVEIIGEGAFYDCINMTSFSFSDKTTAILANAFADCTSLIDVKLPPKLKHLGYSAFYGCHNLKNVYIPASVSSMEDDVFTDCPNAILHCDIQAPVENWPSDWSVGVKKVIFTANYKDLNLKLTEEEFIKTAKRFLDYQTNGSDASWTSNPYKLAWSIKQLDKMIRYFFIANILKWTDLSSALKNTLTANHISKEKLTVISKQISNDVDIWLPYANKAMQIIEGKVTEDLQEQLNNITDDDLNIEIIEEDIEKHDALNPKLFDENEMLNDEVREKMLQIVNAFTEELESDGIKIYIKDIVFIGSNASYNYTKNSDIDLHIIADTSALECPDNLYPTLYSAYRSLFNKKFDISIYDIPVEVYVETDDIPTVSNGIYSIKTNEWLKKPEQTTIPELDKEKFDEEYNIWETKCNELCTQIETKQLTPEESETALFKLLEDIYNLRKESLKSDGEYSIGNLVFKELRNTGMLDKLKDLKNLSKAKKLSLESLQERLNRYDLIQYRNKIWQAIHNQPVMQANGYFMIYQVKENEVDEVIRKLKSLDFVQEANRGAAGGYDFSHYGQFGLPTRKFTIIGKVKDNL